MPSTTYTGPDWSQNPQGLGQNSNFGSNVDRHKTKGSPVVPGSLVTVTSDNDSTLFMVTILRSMYEVSFILCQHKMCTRTYALTLIQCTSCAIQTKSTGRILRRRRIRPRNQNRPRRSLLQNPTRKTLRRTRIQLRPIPTRQGRNGTRTTPSRGG